MGKRRSSGKEPAGYEEAPASSGDDGEWCGVRLQSTHGRIRHNSSALSVRREVAWSEDGCALF
jgi:hypothetical protein